MVLINSDSDAYEDRVGQQLRELRIRAGHDQKHLAALAAVSIGAIQHLENGKGSSLTTLIKVIRALKKTDWLDALAPAIEVSPMQLLRAQNSATPRQKVFRSRKSNAPAAKE